MVRPQKIRIIEKKPTATYFKPRTVPLNELDEVVLAVEEMEALRLADIEGATQEDAAKRMDIHQSTFQRMLKRARRKVADALFNGKAIRIYGGAYTMPRGDETGPAGMGAGTGRGLGRGQGGGAGRMEGPLAGGPGGKCKCPECGYEMEHGRGVPCNQTKCPKCGAMMTRA
ncbi:MAG: DUF134 domain-containing protein [Candidatus Micrarchaeota archaeon]|nr:DUF134 domain-containing protein [Candidatus Micrarchaeota archaeon]